MKKAVCILSLAVLTALPGISGLPGMLRAAHAGGQVSPAAIPTMRTQSNMVRRAVRKGGAVYFKVKNPARLKQLGLTGLAAGDTLEAHNLGSGKWRIVNPENGESVIYHKK